MARDAYYIFLVGVLLFVSPAFAACVTPTNGMVITTNTTLCRGTYDLPAGIDLDAANIVLNCNNSVIRGDLSGSVKGIELKKDFITIANCTVANYSWAEIVALGKNATIYNNSIQNAQIAAGVYLAGGGASVTRNTIDGNDNGIYIASPANQITTNRIYNSITKGIHITSDYNTLSLNLIIGAQSSGIYVDGSFNTFRLNLIINTAAAGVHHYAVELLDAAGEKILSGNIFNGNFLNNNSNGFLDVSLNVTYYLNNIIANSTQYDFNVNTSRAVLINNTFNLSRVHLVGSEEPAGQGNVSALSYTPANMVVKWYLGVRAVDFSARPANMTRVVVKNTDEVEFDGFTGDSGVISEIASTEYTLTSLPNLSMQKTSYDPHRINASKPGFEASVYTCNVNESKDVTLVLQPTVETTDVNKDHVINIIDVAATGMAFGSSPGSPAWNSNADINKDGVINIFDLSVVGRNFGRSY